MLNSVVLLGEDVAGEPVAVRVLLPVHEMLGRRDLQRIAEDPGAAVRRRPKADDLGSEGDRAVVPIPGDMLQRDVNRHADKTALNTQQTAQMRCKIQAAADKVRGTSLALTRASRRFLSSAIG